MPLSQDETTYTGGDCEGSYATALPRSLAAIDILWEEGRGARAGARGGHRLPK